MNKIELEEGDNKFIHIKHNGEEWVLSKDLPWHKEIYRSIDDVVSERDIVGGGRINFDEKNKEIKIYGSSGSYGSTNQSDIKKLVEEKFGSEYTIQTEKEIREKENESKRALEEIAEKEQKKEQKLKLASMVSSENGSSLIALLPVDKRINLYLTKGINKLSPEEVQDYILKTSKLGNVEINLINDFSLGQNVEFRKYLLGEKAIDLIGNKDDIFSLENVYDYVRKLEQLFTVNKDELKPIVSYILKSNGGHEGSFDFKKTILDENYKIESEFGFESEKTLEKLVEVKVKQNIFGDLEQFNYGSEFKKESILEELSKLPKEKQSSTIYDLAFKVLKGTSENSSYSLNNTERGFQLFESFGYLFDDLQKKEFNEKLAENVGKIMDQTRNVYKYKNKFESSYSEDDYMFESGSSNNIWNMLKNYLKLDNKGDSLSYIKENKLKFSLDILINSEFKHILELDRHRELERYPEDPFKDLNIELVKELGVFSKEGLVGHGKYSLYSMLTKVPIKTQSIEPYLDLFSDSLEQKKEIVKEGLDRLSNLDWISEEASLNYFNLVEYLKLNGEVNVFSEIAQYHNIKPIYEKLIFNGKMVEAYKLVENSDDLKKEAVTSIIDGIKRISSSKEKRSYYRGYRFVNVVNKNSFVNRVVSFLDESKVNPMEYEASILGTFDSVLENYDSYSETLSQDKKEDLLNNFKLDIGLFEDSKAGSKLIERYFNNFEESYYTYKYGDIPYEVGNLKKIVEKYNILQSDYMPQIDNLIRSNLENGDIKLVRALAREFNHPEKEAIDLIYNQF